MEGGRFFCAIKYCFICKKIKKNKEIMLAKPNLC